MPPKLRFHLDENVNAVIAKALKNFNIDVTTSPEKNLIASSDASQWEFIKKEGRTLFTHDSDFLIMASKDANHPGIIYSEMSSRTLGQIIMALNAIYNDFTPQEMRGNVEYL
jgi:predicted nuclease of predicted toxin-antitoxin system